MTYEEYQLRQRERLEWNHHVLMTLWKPVLQCHVYTHIIVSPDGSMEFHPPLPELPDRIRELLR